MIIDAIVKLLMGIVKGTMTLFPAFTLPAAVSDVGSSVGSWLGFSNAYFPITALGIALAMVVGVRLFLFAWGLVVFIYDVIPFKAT